MSVIPLGHRSLLHETLGLSARAAPEKTAVITEAESCTFQELDSWSDAVAHTLCARGVRRGDRVAVFLDNTVAAAVSIYGILKAGGVFVLVNPQTKADKLAYIGNDCGARALITDVHLSPVVEQAVPKMPTLSHVLLTGDGEGLRRFEDHGPPVVRWAEAIAGDGAGRTVATGIIPTDLAALIYTSGSTGNPKGVMHTHQSMVFALGSIREYLRLCDDDVLINVLPLSFDYGLYQLLMAVSLPATLVLERSFAYPGQVYRRIVECGVTVFPGVPTVFSLMIAAHGRKPLRFPSVRWITNTAAALPTDYLGRLREIFPNARTFPMYGLTECKRVAYLEPELVEERPGSVGKAIPGTEVFLRSPEGEPVEPGEPGILHVRGPHLMRGYWNLPSRSAEMLLDGGIPGEKVLRTGDWFRMDADGFLYFLGRTDDIIKSRGEKVSPAEVENALGGVQGVAESAVIGVPDEVLGQAIVAFVVLENGFELDERRLRREMTGRLENFMVPHEFVFVEALPKSANGKILKRDLARA